MPYQLLLRNHTENILSELFAHGKCLDFREAPFCVASSDGLPEGARLEFREAKDGMILHNAGTVAVSLGDSDVVPGSEVPLRHGAVLLLGEREVRFYRLHGRPGVSWSANAVGLLAMAGVALSLLIEAAAFCGLGHYLRHSGGIQRQRETQELAARVDQVRKHLKSKELEEVVSKDSLSSAYLAALQEEMDRRVAYLRRHGEELTAAERAAHLDNLRRLEELLERLAEKPTVTPPMPEVQIDGPVRHLIEEK